MVTGTCEVRDKKIALEVFKNFEGYFLCRYFACSNDHVSRFILSLSIPDFGKTIVIGLLVFV